MVLKMIHFKLVSESSSIGKHIGSLVPRATDMYICISDNEKSRLFLIAGKYEAAIGS
jgi:hypothetical protein